MVRIVLLLALVEGTPNALANGIWFANASPHPCGYRGGPKSSRAEDPAHSSQLEGNYSIPFFDTCQAASLHNPQVGPKNILPASESFLNCHFSSATATLANSPPFG